MINKILLVEDDDGDGNPIASSLFAHDMLVEWVKTGEEAIACLEFQKFIAILIDVSLPDMDGLRLTNWIRKQAHIITPIIILTKSKMALTEIASYTAGANYFLVKPIDIDELDKAVRHLHLIGSTCNR